MKSLRYITAVFIATFFEAHTLYAHPEYPYAIDSLLRVLDREIELRPVYLERRDSAITARFAQLARAENSIARYRINSQLYDLLLKYDHVKLKNVLTDNIAIADTLGDGIRRAQAVIRLAYIYSLETATDEIERMLDGIIPERLPDTLRYEYYATLYRNSRAQARLHDGAFKDKFLRQGATYYEKMRDAILEMEHRPAFADLYLTYPEHGEQAIRSLNEYLKRPDITPSTPEYAMATYRLSREYENEGDEHDALAYCISSAISDVRNSLKDHTSMYVLAKKLYDAGDIERAYAYVRISVRDAKDIMSANMLANATDTFIIIHSALEEVDEQKMRTMRTLIVAAILLAAAAIAATLLIRRHAARLAAALAEIEKMNGKYRIAVERLMRVSKMKEKYLVQFLTLGSTCMDNNEELRNKIFKQVRNGNLSNIEKLLKANETANTDAKTFYELFDAAVLQIFPDFVAKINTLLKPVYGLKMKNDTELTLELRILAMITLGIADSASIARYMRSTITTVYTYRSRIRSRAADPENFETAVAEIGRISME